MILLSCNIYVSVDAMYMRVIRQCDGNGSNDEWLLTCLDHLP